MTWTNGIVFDIVIRKRKKLTK